MESRKERTGEGGFEDFSGGTEGRALTGGIEENKQKESSKEQSNGDLGKNFLKSPSAPHDLGFTGQTSPLKTGIGGPSPSSHLLPSFFFFFCYLFFSFSSSYHTSYFCPRSLLPFLSFSFFLSSSSYYRSSIYTYSYPLLVFRSFLFILLLFFFSFFF